jgi:glycosyltransferase involved in cell wall biosynthesis
MILSKEMILVTMVCPQGDIPRVSVLMCTRNGVKCVQAAIDSILAQTFPDFELVALDDGSIDGTVSILCDAAEADSRIRVITQEHLGIPRTLNRGLSLTRAPYFALQDQDDISFPERLAKQVDFFDRHPQVAAVGCFSQVTDWKGRDPETVFYPIDHRGIRDWIMDGNWIVYQASLMRRAALDAVGGFRVEFPICEDIDLFLRLMDHYEVVNIPEVLYQYRRNPESITHGVETLLEHYGQIALELARQRERTGRDLLMP